MFLFMGKNRWKQTSSSAIMNVFSGIIKTINT